MNRTCTANPKPAEANVVGQVALRPDPFYRFRPVKTKKLSVTQSELLSVGEPKSNNPERHHHADDCQPPMSLTSPPDAKHRAYENNDGTRQPNRQDHLLCFQGLGQERIDQHL